METNGRMDGWMDGPTSCMFIPSSLPLLLLLLLLVVHSSMSTWNGGGYYYAWHDRSLPRARQIAIVLNMCVLCRCLSPSVIVYLHAQVRILILCPLGIPLCFCVFLVYLLASSSTIHLKVFYLEGVFGELFFDQQIKRVGQNTPLFCPVMGSGTPAPVLSSCLSF